MKHSNLYSGLVLPSGGWQSLIVASLMLVILLTFMLLDSSIVLLENIYNTDIPYDCQNIFNSAGHRPFLGYALKLMDRW